ncbi:heterokaryon incompatibility protein-domain-containing protein [Ilyonectria destructans]|nr:heterokaryon incompatibility protein-domain-containing protein [Ilyonectria destructans]
MACNTCESINFLPIEHWEHYDIGNPLNVAFAPYQNGRLDYVYYLHHCCFLELVHSARRGCYFCAILWHGLTLAWEAIEAENRTAYSSPIVLRIWWNTEWHSWQDCPIGEPISVFLGSTEIRLERVSAPTANSLFFSRNLENLWATGQLLISDDSTGSSINLELAAKWFETCLQEHAECRLEHAPLPTRVIDVGDPELPCLPILYESAPEERGTYVTLSHCWGGESPIEVCGPLRDRFWILPPLARWPKTFRDAVTVVRKFHIRYLWIDAPCILQGNREDWAIESSRMFQYFHSAAFTIAAAWAENGSKGLFSYRNPLSTRPFRLPLASADPASEALGFYARYMSAEPPGPLRSRAWVLQEELLSRRTLQFGQNYLRWRCFGSRSSEMDPDGTRKEPYRHNPAKGWPHFPMQLDLPDHDTAAYWRRNPFYDTWYTMISDLTSRNITYQKDILPAISGLAESFRPFLEDKDVYLAGLWKEDLEQGLLWVATKMGYGRLNLPPNTMNYAKDDFYAPSWSWVSMGHVKITIHLDEKIVRGGVLNCGTSTWAGRCTEVLSVETRLQNEHAPYGEVTSGAIRFRAQLGQLKISLESFERKGPFYEAMLEGGLQGWMHTHKASMDTAAFRGLDTIEGDCDLDGRDESLIFPHVIDGHIEATFLPLLAHHNDGDLPCRIMGLAMLPTKKPDEYSRIGRAAINLSLYEYTDSMLRYRQFSVI